MKNFILIFSLVTGLFIWSCGLAQENEKPADPNDQLYKTPWSVMVYRGWVSTRSLNESLRFKFNSADEDMYSAELAYTLAPTNPVSRVFKYIGATFQLAGKLGARIEDDRSDDPIGEFNAYFMVRWRNFPWNRYVATTLAVGDGISYVTRVPEVEKEDDPNDSQKLLNYLVFEATFAHPSHPRFQLVYRLHHRSGAYGLFDDSDFGSNALGLGLRYHF